MTDLGQLVEFPAAASMVEQRATDQLSPFSRTLWTLLQSLVAQSDDVDLLSRDLAAFRERLMHEVTTCQISLDSSSSGSQPVVPPERPSRRSTFLVEDLLDACSSTGGPEGTGQSSSSHSNCTRLSTSPKGSDDGSSFGPSSNGSLPAWIFCTRYSDRPSAGPRLRKPRQRKPNSPNAERRPRTSFSAAQLGQLTKEFNANNYLSETRRRQLSLQLHLKESQVKIWFQNKRAKTKKSTRTPNSLAHHLMAEGLYNHSVRLQTTATDENATVTVSPQQNS